MIASRAETEGSGQSGVRHAFRTAGDPHAGFAPRTAGGIHSAKVVCSFQRHGLAARHLRPGLSLGSVNVLLPCMYGGTCELVYLLDSDAGG